MNHVGAQTGLSPQRLNIGLSADSPCWYSTVLLPKYHICSHPVVAPNLYSRQCLVLWIFIMIRDNATDTHIGQ
jgi:hypothetical protein